MGQLFMCKKYELTDEEIVIGFHKLYRIRALKDFGNVKVNELGGFIEDEQNLSHENDCWVCDNAKVFGNAVVYDNAKVFGNAMVYDNAKVFGNAMVYDNTKVIENALIYDEARVFGDVRVCGENIVAGNTVIWGNANVCSRTKISPRVSNNGRVQKMCL
ncbi:hypothetical protein Bcsk_011110 [Bartonella sp. CDC_skunk]|nr:hypothetical protein Bcsk_011110 [Bartonella sp. CDC_skunk]AQX27009.1 hypothetical protein Bra60_010120 [Bartonella sp. Raccoon60]